MVMVMMMMMMMMLVVVVVVVLVVMVVVVVVICSVDFKWTNFDCGTLHSATCALSSRVSGSLGLSSPPLVHPLYCTSLLTEHQTLGVANWQLQAPPDATWLSVVCLRLHLFGEPLQQ